MALFDLDMPVTIHFAVEDTDTSFNGKLLDYPKREKNLRTDLAGQTRTGSRSSRWLLDLEGFEDLERALEALQLLGPQGGHLAREALDPPRPAPLHQPPPVLGHLEAGPGAGRRRRRCA